MPGTAFSSANWSGYDEATASNPSSALTDFSLLINVANLSADWKAAVQSDGADIRITKGDGTTELPYDLIDWVYNAGSPTGWIRVKYSSTLASSGTQNVRVWAGYTGGTAVAYDASETFGSDNAYDSNWAGYWPNGGTGDRTSNGVDGTAEGSVTVGGATGKVGSATTYDGSDDTVDLGTTFSYPCTAMLWFKAASTPAGTTLTLGNAGPNGQFFQMGQLNTRFFMKVGNSSNTITGSGDTISVGTWYHQAQTWDGDNARQLINAAQKLTATPGDVAFSNNMAIGSDNAGLGEWPGEIDEVQFHEGVIRSDAWITQEYSQSNDTASFWGTWAWTEAGGGGNSVLTAESSSFALSGSPASLTKGYRLGAAGASFSLSASPVSIRHNRVLGASGKTLTLTAGNVTFESGRRLLAEPVSFSAFVSEIGLIRGYSLPTDSESLNFSFGEANFIEGLRLEAEPATYSLTVGDSLLTRSYVASLDSGSFLLSAGDATLTAGETLRAEGVNYQSDMGSATLVKGRSLNAGSASFDLTGFPVFLTRSYVLNAEPASYTLTGMEVTLLTAGEAIVGGRFVIGQVYFPGFQEAQTIFPGFRAGDVTTFS